MGDLCALVGRNVRRARLAAGVTQEELAHRTGLDRTWLSDIERGIGNPSLRWLQDVAAALSTHPALFLVEEREAGPIQGILITRPGDAAS